MSQYLSTFWDSNYPNPTAGACVALKHMKLVNVACDNSQKNFYDFTTGFKPFLNKNIELTKNSKSIISHLSNEKGNPYLRFQL